MSLAMLDSKQQVTNLNTADLNNQVVSCIKNVTANQQYSNKKAGGTATQTGHGKPKVEELQIIAANASLSTNDLNTSGRPLVYDMEHEAPFLPHSEFSVFGVDNSD